MRASPRNLLPLALVPAALLTGWVQLPAQVPPPEGFTERPRVNLAYPAIATRETPLLEAAPTPRAPRLQLVGMPTGFLANPFGLPEETAPPLEEESFLTRAPGQDDLLSMFQVSYGIDNPHLDLRLPGDPGGLGYRKLYSQVQLLDAGTTSVCLGLQALTPAGLQAGGVEHGPTMVNPSIAWFQDLGDGLAVQGYFGPNIQADSRWAGTLAGNLLYGMAVQYPVPGTSPAADQGMFFTVQALGRYQSDDVRTDGRPLLWEVVPGVHMRWNPNCWMSLGVSRYNFLSCSWQF